MTTKLQYLLSISMIAGIIAACNPGKGLFGSQKIVLKGQLESENACKIDTVRLYRWSGVKIEEITKTALIRSDKTASFQFEVPKTYEGIYYIGISDQNNSSFLIRGEKSILLTGTCDNLKQLQTKNSPKNEAYKSVLEQLSKNNKQFFGYINASRVLSKTEDEVKEMNQKFASLDHKRVAYLDSLKSKDTFLSNIASLNTYLSYQNNKLKNQVEAEYFAKNYFRFANFKDENIYKTPSFQEAFRTYAGNISKVGLPQEKQEFYCDSILTQLTIPSKNHRSAVFGLLVGSVGNNESNFVKYTKEYFNHYKGSYPQLEQTIAERMISIKGLMIGEPAPEISDLTPSGETMSLSQLKGKIVLIDFWASWCGPCRKENPHVVKLYKKYKEKGFEILSVSLDRDKKRWINAIEKDGMNWHHVSDLKQWQSKHARLYGVRSIPYTVLLDRDGNIAAKQLRGHALEQKLLELLK